MGGLGLLNKQIYSPQELAELACHLEIDLCKEPIGKQDQYAASFGGLNFYEIDRSGAITVSKDILVEEQMQVFDKCLYLVFTGVKRSASQILKRQEKNILEDEEVNQRQQRIVSLAYEAYELLKKGDFYQFGELLDVGWQEKKSLSEGISNPDLDDLYNEGIKAGATGGKILGAGGGGYFLFFVPPKNHDNFETRFKDNIIRITTSKFGFQCHYET
jgi:D-glycero-alpha-D-manno-heptose-7-phosphate kinase